MALFKQFSGAVVDINGSTITSFRCKGYHKQSGTWSKWYTSNDTTGQYNMNMGDASWLSQSGSVASGDNVVLVFETLESTISTRSFCVYETTLVSAQNVYIQNVQLRMPTAPSIKDRWTLYSPSFNGELYVDTSNKARVIYKARTRETVTIKQTFTDDYSWTYASATFKHVASLYGQDIFSDRVGIKLALYDWNTDIYSDTVIRTYTSATTSASGGYIPVKAKVTNVAGLISTDILYLQIRLNPPPADIIWTPEIPSIKDTLVITGVISTLDNNLINVNYSFDTNAVATDTTLTYTWNQGLDSNYVKEHIVSALVKWTDGFDVATFTHTETIEMLNLPPVFYVVKKESTKEGNIRLALTNLSDPDGITANVRVKWNLEFIAPMATDYLSIYATDYPETPNARYIDLPLVTSGSYKMIATAIDEAGGESSNFVEFTIEQAAQSITPSKAHHVEWE